MCIVSSCYEVDHSSKAQECSVVSNRYYSHTVAQSGILFGRSQSFTLSGGHGLFGLFLAAPLLAQEVSARSLRMRSLTKGYDENVIRMFPYYRQYLKSSSNLVYTNCYFYRRIASQRAMYLLQLSKYENKLR